MPSFDCFAFTGEIIRPLLHECGDGLGPAIGVLQAGVHGRLKAIQETEGTSEGFREREKLRHDLALDFSNLTAPIILECKRRPGWGARGTKILAALAEVERASHAAAMAFL